MIEGKEGRSERTNEGKKGGRKEGLNEGRKEGRNFKEVRKKRRKE